MSERHEPVPWSVSYSESEVSIEGGNGRIGPIAVMVGSRADREANAEFMVACVNGRDRVAGAIRGLLPPSDRSCLMDNKCIWCLEVMAPQEDFCHNEECNGFKAREVLATLSQKES